MMDQVDAGTYLTERLRAVEPHYFEEELARGKRVAKRVGFLLGSLFALIGSAAAVVSLIVLAPETAEAFFFGLQ
jgi:hypothetical protein